MTVHDEHSDGRPADSRPGALPEGLRCLLDPGVERHPGTDDRTVLLGGQPLRLLRLAPRSAALLGALAGGATIGEAAASSGVSAAAADTFVRRMFAASVLHPDPEPLDVDVATDVTVVIPVKDRADSVVRLFDAIAAARPRPAAVIVVDDGSTDGTGDAARRRGAQVLRHETARGPAAARNTGARAATTPVVAFIDSDCVPAPDWLARLAAHLVDDAVVAVAPRIVGLPRTAGKPAPLAAYEAVRSALDLGPLPAPVLPRTRVAYVPTAALLVRRAAFEAMGGFDERLHVGEDVDAVWRLVAHGGTVRYEPRATVAHDHLDTLPAFTRRRAQYGTSAAPLTTRHPGMVPPLVVSPWTLASWTAAATQTVTGAAAAAAITEWSARQLPRKLPGVADATPLGRRLARRGHLGTGRQLASALIRTYHPVALAASLVSRRARRVLVAAAVVPGVLEWRERRPKLDPVRYTALRVVEDAAYCGGVWLGCLRERTWQPLRPVVVDWPGRTKVTEDR